MTRSALPPFGCVGRDEAERLVAVSTGAKDDDRPVSDREDVEVQVTGRSCSGGVDAWRAAEDEHVLAARNDLLKLGAQLPTAAPSDPIRELLATMTHRRRGIRDARVEIRPLEIVVDEVQDRREVTRGEARERLTSDLLWAPAIINLPSFRARPSERRAA
jgi:hypothetical protein